MKRAAVLISGSGSNLQAFIDHQKSADWPLEIKLVVSNNPDAFGLERAERAGIANVTIDHRDYHSREEFDAALLEEIDKSEPDLVILAGFMRILTPEFVAHYAGRLINIHPSLLPKYPGPHTHERALAAGDAWHGASIHFVVPEVDAGPIILQGQLKVHATDTPESLQQRIHKIEHQLYPLAARWVAEERLQVRADEVLLDGEISSEQLQTFDV